MSSFSTTLLMGFLALFTILFSLPLAEALPASDVNEDYTTTDAIVPEADDFSETLLVEEDDQKEIPPPPF